jgi:hypothetical protein
LERGAGGISVEGVSAANARPSAASASIRLGRCSGAPCSRPSVAKARPS